MSKSKGKGKGRNKHSFRAKMNKPVTRELRSTAKDPVRKPSIHEAPVSMNLARGPLAAKNQCVGILSEHEFGGIVQPDVGYDKQQYGRIFIRKNQLFGAPFGMKVVCEILNPDSEPQSYEGRIIEVLGDPGNGDIAILSILKQNGLSTVFPDAVQAQADTFPVSPEAVEIEKAIASGRRDLRDLMTITMDGEDAKDLDDAISIQELPGKGHKLYVHIADVSNYVTEQSVLDEEARKRATSVYLVDRVIPMLPPRLSNGLCSLNPHLPRFALTAEMIIGNDGEIIAGEIYESVIESDARTSYKEVYGVLFENKYLDQYRDFIGMFSSMQSLKDILSRKRMRRGALEFTMPETRIELDQQGKPLSIFPYPTTYANEIIEEFMIACNEFVATKFDRLTYPFIYRIHEDPDEQKIATFFHVAKLFGMNATIHGKPTSYVLAQLMNSIKDEDFAPALSQILLRSLAKAKYSDQNIGHFGLASECYCHFTSPIRRYPDLYIHRIIKDYIHGGHNRLLFAAQVEGISDHSSLMERNAMETERATVDQKVAEYMKEHIGSEFDGIISSIFTGGIFVRLESTVEGLIPFRTMNDYFAFDEKKLEARGKTSGKTYRIGEKVRVVVAASDTTLRRVDFILADENPNGKRRPDNRISKTKNNMPKRKRT